MLADLHLHTHHSDSTRSPQELVLLAKEQGFGLISICDHNIISAYDEVIPLCKKNDIRLIVGAEINALYEGKEYHILAYGFDMDDKGINELLDYSSDILVQKGIEIITNMSADYNELSLEEFLQYKRNTKNGGWPSIDYLANKGLIKSIHDFFGFSRRYNTAKGNEFKTIEAVADTIHKAGGKAVVAHAGDMVDNNPNIFSAMLPKLLSQEIDGFECYYTSHKPEITKTLVEFCKAHDLLITAGSDDHGGFNSQIDGIDYYLGAVRVDTADLNLKGLI